MLLCRKAADFTTEHLCTGFSYSTDFSGITSLVWFCLHFEVTKLCMNNKTVSPLLHYFPGLFQSSFRVLPISRAGFILFYEVCIYLFSSCLLLQEADALICTDGHTGDVRFPFSLAEHASFLR